MAGHRTVFHLFEVTAGLDSLVLGENEVLGQVKQAYSTAVGVQATGAVTNKLFHLAFEVGKRVRTETGINAGSLSVAKVACRLVAELCQAVAHPQVLLVGAGETGRQTAQTLRESVSVELRVTNRSAEKAETLAREVDGSPVPFADLVAEVRRADVVISATDSPQPLIHAADLAGTPRPADRPLLVLDLAVPRDVDPGVAQLPGVRLVNVDDLAGIVAQNRARREACVEPAFQLVEQQTKAFLDWYRSRLAASAIEDLQLRFEEIRRTELYRNRNRFSENDLNQVDDLTRSMVNKMLAVPILQLRAMTTADKDPHGILHFFKKLFALDRDEPKP